MGLEKLATLIGPREVVNPAKAATKAAKVLSLSNYINVHVSALQFKTGSSHPSQPGRLGLTSFSTDLDWIMHTKLISFPLYISLYIGMHESMSITISMQA